eukprot:5803410-Amphidinium_carterae.1
MRRLLSAGSASDQDGPLWPNSNNGFVEKKAVAETVKMIMVSLGDSASRVTGHSFRCTGAQMFARAGVSEWRIMLFGRWGSTA